MAHYNIIIKNGSVFDGKGNAPKKLDVGISGDSIKKIGNLQEDTAEQIIDAEGKYVCPGFIDLTNHSDTHWTLFSDPNQESLVKQGITTILGGNCGSSIAPLVGQKGLKRIERKIDASRMNVNWQSMDELFTELQNRKVAINFASLVGLGTLIDATENEIGSMQFLLEKSLKEGAFGLSTSLGLAKTNSLSDDALISLFSIVAKHKGITKHHLKDEGANILPAISRLIQLTRKAGAHLHISHFKVLGKKSWTLFDDALSMLRSARKKGVFGFPNGVRLTIDFFPYTRTGADLFVLLPEWLREKNREDIKTILQSRDNKQRKAVVEYFKNLTLHYDRIMIASSFKESSVVGKNLLEISELMNIPPEEVIIKLLAVNDLHVSMFSEVISGEHIKALAQEDYAAIVSDGVGYDSEKFESGTSVIRNILPHPRSFGAFPKALKMFSKENGVVMWEKIIYKMTGLPAGILGIKDRGVIKKRNKADVIVFNPEEIADYATYEKPLQFAKGIENVLINGEMVLNNSVLTGNLVGRVLRKG